jgi:YfiH family protein
MKGWRWENRADGVKIIVRDDWAQQGVDFAFTGRGGGSSRGSWASFNLSFRVGDVPEAVRANRQQLMAIFHREAGAVTETRQVHGAQVLRCDADFTAGEEAYRLTPEGEPPEADALISHQTGRCLNMFFADCIPLAFFDQVRRAVALTHAGWKGTVLDVAGATVRSLTAHYGCEPRHIEALIGPGIGPCCFAISPDLAERVRQEWGGADEIAWRGSPGVPYWDLKRTNRRLLLAAGLTEEHLLDCGLCTSCGAEDFFSYRRDNGITGRMGAVIALREV